MYYILLFLIVKMEIFGISYIEQLINQIVLPKDV